MAIYYLCILKPIWTKKIPLLYPPLDKHHQRRLLPKPEDLLLMPVTTFLVQRQIKVPQQSRHNEAHLVVRQIPPNAISRAETKRPVDVSAVVVEG